MAETDSIPQEPQEPTPQDPHGADPVEPVDWEAKYNEAKAHSRKWEDMAKKNKAAAKELEEIKQSQMTEAERAAEAEKRAANAEAAQKAAEAKLERLGLVQEVASEHKVPAALLKGDTKEELEASAKALLEFAGSIPPEIPTDQGGAGKPPTITEASLNDIKNPIDRIKAREAMNSLV